MDAREQSMIVSRACTGRSKWHGCSKGSSQFHLVPAVARAVVKYRSCGVGGDDEDSADAKDSCR